MLVNVNLNLYDDGKSLELYEKLKEEYGHDSDVIGYLEYRIEYNKQKPEQTGIYLDAGLNFEHEFKERLDFKQSYPTLGEKFESSFGVHGSLSPYGVADNIGQVLELYKDDLADPNRKFCISTCPIVKAEQPEHGGWRWHKWGPYIGTFDKQCEYLYDEEGIEQVIVFHIYEVSDSMIAE